MSGGGGRRVVVVVVGELWWWYVCVSGRGEEEGELETIFVNLHTQFSNENLSAKKHLKAIQIRTKN
jgi:hypothetical protein